jgi:hypothetical protein
VRPRPGWYNILCKSDSLIATRICVSDVMIRIMPKLVDFSKTKNKKNFCKGYMYGSKLTYSLTIDLLIIVCFINLSLKMAEILNSKNE